MGNVNDLCFTVGNLELGLAARVESTSRGPQPEMVCNGVYRIISVFVGCIRFLITVMIVYTHACICKTLARHVIRYVATDGRILIKPVEFGEVPPEIAGILCECPVQVLFHVLILNYRQVR